MCTWSWFGRSRAWPAGRDDAVVGAPDHQSGDGVDEPACVLGLIAGVDEPACQRLQALLHPVEPLVLEQVLDKLARDQRRIAEELPDMRLELAAAAASVNTIPSPIPPI